MIHQAPERCLLAGSFDDPLTFFSKPTSYFVRYDAVCLFGCNIGRVLSSSSGKRRQVLRLCVRGKRWKNLTTSTYRMARAVRVRVSLWHCPPALPDIIDDKSQQAATVMKLRVELIMWSSIVFKRLIPPRTFEITSTFDNSRNETLSDRSQNPTCVPGIRSSRSHLSCSLCKSLSSLANLSSLPADYVERMRYPLIARQTPPLKLS